MINLPIMSVNFETFPSESWSEMVKNTLKDMKDSHDLLKFQLEQKIRNTISLVEASDLRRKLDEAEIFYKGYVEEVNQFWDDYKYNRHIIKDKTPTYTSLQKELSEDQILRLQEYFNMVREVSRKNLQKDTADL